MATPDYKTLAERYGGVPKGNINPFGEYWYIVAKSEGKVVLLGPYNSESDANEMALAKLEGTYETVPLKTRDRAKATQIVRHKMLTEGSDLAASLRRMKHQV